MLWVVAHTCIVTNQSDALPVLVIDGASFADFTGFVRETRTEWFPQIRVSVAAFLKLRR
ncbi:hypothetical protein EV384_0507 [Micromonospora kangleipakensis]|uniref:Uncharacterized protein n=1 Tax=Micromonospora kangleipakensis TaxID=1077942 RepID=A0A4Q8B5N0_9ACTN|nr:hypothetical protein EV384_0507 [Micromonospora kangleipakensis]